jgi:nucleotide-binding universal stress UspA family protein
MAGEIVLGYDGQAGSVAALRTATAIASAFNRPLVIVFGYRPAAIGGEVTDLGKAVRKVGEGFTAEAVEQAHEQDASVDVQVEIVDLRPADAVLQVAEEHDALVIVVGTTGRGPIAGSLLGSVTYQVVHRSTRPVVVVPAPEGS